MNNTELTKTLPIKNIADAIEEAKQLIEAERTGDITGLFTRFEGVNRAKMKYWRFRSVTCIAGMSGGGKSAFLNMLEDDFTNPVLNPTFLRHQDKDGNWQGKDRLVVLAFKYEMDAADEILRNLSGKISKSYSYLLSSEVQRKDEKGNDIGQLQKASYNKITEEDFLEYSKELDKLKNKPIKFVENAGNLDQLFNTCLKVKEENPDKMLIVTIDHTLLSLKLSEKDDSELMSRTAKIGIRIKKQLNGMLIFLGQLNGEIEKVQRRENADLHFPVKTDIHAQNQIYWACDDVMIIHRPELLGIDKYGKKPFAMNSKGLIHLNWIKSRKNKTGWLWFRNLFNEGKILQVEPEEFKYGEDTFQI